MKNDGSTTKDNRRKELLFLNIRIANNLSIKPTTILKYFCVTISNKYTDQIIAVESYLHF